MTTVASAACSIPPADDDDPALRRRLDRGPEHRPGRLGPPPTTVASDEVALPSAEWLFTDGRALITPPQPEQTDTRPLWLAVLFGLAAGIGLTATAAVVVEQPAPASSRGLDKPRLPEGLAFALCSGVRCQQPAREPTFRVARQGYLWQKDSEFLYRAGRFGS